METDPLTSLKMPPFRGVNWGEDDRPVLIADGTLHRADRLESTVHADYAYVVGVNEKSFSRLCPFLLPKTLHFYEMRVRDLSPIAEMKDLVRLAIRWNTKLDDISPISQLRDLEVLVLEDTPKLSDISPISRCQSLSAIEFSGGIWNKNSADSLEPISKLPRLEHLALTNLGVKTDGLKPLARCPRLRTLEVSNQFATEDYAYLSVKLPLVECDKFAPYVSIPQPIDGKDVMVIGKRKPLLNAQEDKSRLQKYEDAFRKLQDRFAAEDIE